MNESAFSPNLLQAVQIIRSLERMGKVFFLGFAQKSKQDQVTETPKLS